MNISLLGLGETTATFEAESRVTVGMPVKMSGDGRVGPCALKDKFFGVAVNVRGGYAAVQISGYARVQYSGTAPAVGYQTLNGAGDGTAQVEATGRSLLVTDVDTAAKTCGILL